MNDHPPNDFLIYLYMISDILANSWSKSQGMDGTGNQYYRETRKSVLKGQKEGPEEPLGYVQ